MSERRIVLLQGPLGPFFSSLAGQLAEQGCRLYKINFNGGDWLFTRQRHFTSVDNFTGTVDDWPGYFRDYLLRHKITDCIVYGDCRFYHQQAYVLAEQCQVQFWTFEEGYLRPDFITLERGRVNGYSELDRRKHVIQRKINQAENSSPEQFVPVGRTFMQRMIFASLYYWAFSFGQLFFPHYRHHRVGRTFYEGVCWIRSGWRKLLYGVTQWRFAKRFSQRWQDRFFLVPLQVHNDSQILFHSKYSRLEQFIREVLHSFASNAPVDHALVFKHHPVDRGFTHYKALIQKISASLGISHRVFYCFDAHLPTLERNAKGAVTINSTVGLSCLFKGLPTKALGNAIYAVDGLTSGQSLDDFWQLPQAVDRQLVADFRAYLWQQTQLNGNFYKYQYWTCRKAASQIAAAPHYQSKPLQLVPVIDVSALMPTESRIPLSTATAKTTEALKTAHQ